MGSISVKPVTRANRGDFEALFSARGCPGFCWCTAYRVRDHHEMTRAQKRAAMIRRVQAGTPVGVLAYQGGEPVGWCSVAPRESYGRLERSRTMPAVEQGAWTVVCFFVRRSHRGRGVPRRLLEGAVRYARASGALVVEGYPADTAGISATHRGRSGWFKALGFRRSGRRWALRLRQSH